MALHSVGLQTPSLGSVQELTVQLTELSWIQAQNVAGLGAQVHATGWSLLVLKLGHCPLPMQE